MTILPRHHTPTVHQRTTRHTFNAVRPSARDSRIGRYFDVHVEERRAGVWQVVWQHELLSCDGGWDYPPPGEMRDEVWLLAHTFTEAEATARARAVAGTLVFQGVHVDDVRHGS